MSKVDSNHWAERLSGLFEDGPPDAEYTAESVKQELPDILAEVMDEYIYCSWVEHHLIPAVEDLLPLVERGRDTTAAVAGMRAMLERFRQEKPKGRR